MIIHRHLRHPEKRHINYPVYYSYFTGQLMDAFKKKPEPFQGHANAISLAILNSFENSYLANGLGFIWDLAKEYPEVYS